MPFFKGGQNIPPSSRLQRQKSLPVPPIAFVDEDDVITREEPQVQLTPKKELNASAKRFARKAGKESGLRKLMRRHSSKLPREVEVTSPPTLAQNGTLRNRHHSVGSDDEVTVGKRSTGNGTKVTFAATVEQDVNLDYNRNGTKKPWKPLRKSKSINVKMPLQSALKPSSISSNSSMISPPPYTEYEIKSAEARMQSENNGWIANQYAMDRLGKMYFYFNSERTESINN